VGAHAVHAFLDFNFHVPANALVIALLFGFLANPSGGIRETPSAAERLFDRTFGIVLFGLGAWMAAIAVTKFPAEFFHEKTALLDANWTSEEMDPLIEKSARSGLAFDPEIPDLHHYLGKSLIDQGFRSDDSAESARMKREGIAAHRRALELAPQDVKLVLALAGALDKEKRFDESQPLYERALSMDPNGGWVRAAYAAHLHRRGLLDQAEKEYLRASVLGWSVEPGLSLVRKARK
jgi:tetratricopeptide (TPR) repeat protein